MNNILKFGFGACVGIVATLCSTNAGAIVNSVTQSSDPQKLVNEYITDQSNVRFQDANKLLSGEAAIVNGNQTSTMLHQDPVVHVTLKPIYQSSDFSQVSADITTKGDRVFEVFYLKKINGNWRIFSIQQPNENWNGLGKGELNDEQRKTIVSYTQDVQSSNLLSALNLLCGNARVKASTLNISNESSQKPVRNLTVSSMQEVGTLENGNVLVDVRETIGNQVSEKESLLYTLSPIENHWKIADIRVMERSLQP